jgi:SAM-dependent methyltransferase
MFMKFLQGMVARDRNTTCDRCYRWGGELVARLRPQALLDVGCGDGSFLLKYLDYRPETFCGIEAAPALRLKAEARGLQVAGIDLNGPWPYPDASFDVVHSAQVIEHLHNTRLFAQEAFRVLKPGGTAVVASENLTSFLNTGAMLLGYTPFTLLRVCGWYLGNPLGLHAGETDEDGVPITDPAFAGVTGHIRALSVLQAQELFERIGFQTQARSLGLMPIPEWMGRHLERLMPRRGHFLIVEARKPAAPGSLSQTR